MDFFYFSSQFYSAAGTQGEVLTFTDRGRSSGDCQHRLSPCHGTETAPGPLPCALLHWHISQHAPGREEKG